jgi:hypothetical protein
VARITGWLVGLLRNPAFRKWVAGVLGPGAIRAFAKWIQSLRRDAGGRATALERASQVRGHFSFAVIDGQRRVVVWKEGTPLEAFPAVEGDLAEKLEHYDLELLRDARGLSRAERARTKWLSR